jgi:hypothetical protein
LAERGVQPGAGAAGELFADHVTAQHRPAVPAAERLGEGGFAGRSASTW